MECCGYSCKFVEAIPKELQTECSICLHTIRNPYMVDCCGYRFCEACIMPLKSVKKCPLCNCTFSSTIHDKLLQRTLNDKLVYCTHKDAGCDWTGKLVTLDQHLNATPDSDNRMEGCSVQAFECSYCDDKFKRCDMSDHESNCSLRPITCKYCETFSAPVAELEEHWEVCESYPIQCKNECGETVKREKMYEHLNEQCPLEDVRCEYSYAGCDMIFPRKDMNTHIDEAAKDHLQLVTNKLTKQGEELRKLMQICTEHEATQRELSRKLNLVQGELMQKDMVLQQQRTSTADQLALKDKMIRLLKALCNARDDGGNLENQVLVTNISCWEGEQVLKSLFGQFGRIKHVEVYSFSWNGMMAVIEYKERTSLNRLFDTYRSGGIKLRKVSLECIRLSSI